MRVCIKSDMDDEIMLDRELDDDEILDCDIYAAEIANLYGFTIDTRDGHVPLGLADFTVELADQPNTGDCWTAQSYFIAPE